MSKNSAGNADSRLRVVLDTNVIISALIHPGQTRVFVSNLLRNEIEICLSNYILDEIEEVLARRKFKNRPVLDRLRTQLEQSTTVANISTDFNNTPLRDPKDHPILQTAEIAHAKFIVTGDKDLLELKEWKNVQMVTMNGFTSKHIFRLDNTMSL